MIKITPQFKAHKHQIRIVDTDADDEKNIDVLEQYNESWYSFVNFHQTIPGQLNDYAN